jgi:transketolase
VVTPATSFVSTLVSRTGPLHLYSADATQSMRIGGLTERMVVHDVGVAEHLALAMAAGRASASGKRVLVTGFSAFLSTRGAECLRLIARDRLPVTVLGLLPGVSAGRDGAAHQCLHEVGMLGSFGLESLLWPADPAAAVAAAETVAAARGPSWVALERAETARLPAWTDAQRLARWRMVRPARGPTIVTYGRLVHVALQAGSDCSIVEVLDPLGLDSHALHALLERAGPRVLVVEEQAAPGPLAARCQAIAPALLVKGLAACPTEMQSGSQAEVLAAVGLSVAHIEKSLLELGD